MKTHLRQFAQLWLMALLAVACNGVIAQQQRPTSRLESEIANTLAGYVRDDALLERSVSAAYGTGLSPEKRDVAKAVLRSLMSSEQMPGYLTRLLAPVMGPNLSKNEGREYVMEGVSALQTKGLRRLPTQRQVQFLKHTLDMAGAVPSSMCKALFLGKLNTAQANLLERRYAASLPLGRFEALMAMYQNAAEAELAGYPDLKILSATQAKGAERAYEGVMKGRIQRMPPGLNERVLDDLDGSEPIEACKWFRETTGAALDLKEPYLGWYMTRFIDSMQ